MYNLNFRQQQYPNLNCDELIQYQYIPTLVDVLKGKLGDLHSISLSHSLSFSLGFFLSRILSLSLKFELDDFNRRCL